MIKQIWKRENSSVFFNNSLSLSLCACRALALNWVAGIIKYLELITETGKKKTTFWIRNAHEHGITRAQQQG